MVALVDSEPSLSRTDRGLTQKGERRRALCSPVAPRSTSPGWLPLDDLVQLRRLWLRRRLSHPGELRRGWSDVPISPPSSQRVRVGLDSCGLVGVVGCCW